MEKPWSGRFKEETDKFVEDFTESVSFDKELAFEDIEQDIAHVKTLQKAGILTEEEARELIQELLKIKEEIKEGKFQWKKELEDVHMNIEAELINRLGDVGRKLHTARSRNDQVATDEKLYLKKEIKEVLQLLKELRKTLVELAETTVDFVMPSYTHLQRAQPIRVAHYFLAYREILLKDSERLMDTYRRVDELPLGSGAVAGVDFPLDRFYTAELLGFNRVTRNSMYATAERDFIIEFLSNCALIAQHLSRLAEDLIIWNTEEFNFVELPDKLCTGSSIMPQKKNPDVLELIRGKTGRIYGNLIALLTTMKALPMAYNRDMQEDKEPLFDTLKNLKNMIKGMTLVLSDLRVKEQNMRKASGNFLLITDIANYLVEKGVPFRTAHHIAGSIVAYLLEKGKKLEEMTLEEFKQFSEKFEEDVFDILSPERAADRKRVYGGTAKEEILRIIEVAKAEEGL
ncbi:argininosuccinate lyase [Aquifex aeolicus]|uniref:Argininosuccinate lyase n=1 Tax=Aquifex aeolicus (strain VF5) TaxID=224324 RepID=ARLY_AQUAE|nr:argininosuccinate lyase [Aquifex aeolicus]O67383.1 RecName: Full=Argininosuccinate lyase; Short=ASAL; AltName: Full=Arginosuccinase [Aquifex aeolicus VF5]AAC07341.1 argininosuccinate lyase [Aquifex aeolicus VF5]